MPSAESGSALERAKELLSTDPPLLPEDELRGYVETFFKQRDRYLRLAQDGPLPTYALELDRLRQRANEFREAFEAALPATSFFYAMKSNNHPDVAACLVRCGYGLDASSGGELDMAQRVGAERVVFSGPGKTDEELDRAVSLADITTVLIDSPGELTRLESRAERVDVQVNAGVRLNTSSHGLWRKFGVPLDDLLRFWEQAERCPHVNLQGIQLHTSWNLSPAAQVEAITTLGRELATWPDRLRHSIEFLDIGGGVWPPRGEWLQAQATPSGRLLDALDLATLHPLRHYRLPATAIGEFAAEIAKATEAHIQPIAPCRICFEPGRWVCNDAMHILMRVIDKKTSDLVITNAGTNIIGWERFESDYAPVLNLTRPALKEEPCHILGSLCTPHDVWGYAYFGESIEEGDVLMIPDQGAYTYSLRQEFIKPLPSVRTI